jgi:hypothetical protein
VAGRREAHVTSFIIFAVFIVIGLIAQAANKKKAAQGGGRNPGTPSPRMQKVIERLQAQQGTNRPIQFQGQFTQPTSGPPMQGQVTNSAGQVVRPAGPMQNSGRAQASAQLAGMIQQLMQAGQTTGHFSQPITGPGQTGSLQAGPMQPGPQTGYTPPGQFQPPQYQGQFQPPQPPPWVPAYQQPPQARRPQQSKGDLEARVRQLMSTGNEVTAVRLLSDERDLGIIEAQKYARSLVAGPEKARSTAAAASDPDSTEPGKDEEFRYVGSAAFAESLFDTGGDENSWASGWVDKPEPEDRTDMDELWQTVQNAGRPKPPPQT